MDKTKPDGHLPRCRSCKKQDRHASYMKNPDKINQYALRYREQNRKRIDEKAKEWAKSNPDKINNAAKQYRIRNPEKSKLLWTRWNEKNRGKRRLIGKRSSKKYRSSPRGKLTKRISDLIRMTLNGEKRGRSWELLVGYNVDQLKQHLENQFLPGMSWENRGLWHIDHRIPVSAFNYKTPEDIDFKKCWALKNLQPLWKIDNLAKGDRLDKPFQPSLAL